MSSKRNAPAAQSRRNKKTGGAKQAPVAPKSKGSTTAALLRAANSGVGLLGNALLPGAGTLASKIGGSILDKLGFAEKNVSFPMDFGNSPGTQGGVIVQTASAPVAFSREEGEMTGIQHVMSRGDDHVYLIRDYVSNVTYPLSPGGLEISGFQANPMSPQYAVASAFCANFQSFRLLKAKLHFVHYAPTSSQARVGLAYTENEDSTITTFQRLVSLEDAAVGSAYEDFSLEFTPTASLNWYPTQYVSSPDPSYETRTYSQGTYLISVDQNVPTGIAFGALYVEQLVALRKQRMNFTLAMPGRVLAAVSKERRVELLAAMLKDAQTGVRFDDDYFAVLSRAILPPSNRVPEHHAGSELHMLLANSGVTEETPSLDHYVAIRKFLDAARDNSRGTAAPK